MVGGGAGRQRPCRGFGRGVASGSCLVGGSFACGGAAEVGPQDRLAELDVAIAALAASKEEDVQLLKKAKEAEKMHMYDGFKAKPYSASIEGIDIAILCRCAGTQGAASWRKSRRKMWRK